MRDRPTDSVSAGNWPLPFSCLSPTRSPYRSFFLRPPDISERGCFRDQNIAGFVQQH
jgi:hypothetical protein